MSLLTFYWQGNTVRFHLRPLERAGRMGPMAIFQTTPGVAGEGSINVEVPLADLVVLGHAAQGALDARRATKGLDS